MRVTIRSQSADDPRLMRMLQSVTQAMLERLMASGITLADDSVKIWVKEHPRTGRRFPKIEFDAHGQELQYDLDEDGIIKEIHFKSFDKTSGRISRSDLKPEDACALLRNINDILCPNGPEN